MARRAEDPGLSLLWLWLQLCSGSIPGPGASTCYGQGLGILPIATLSPLPVPCHLYVSPVFPTSEHEAQGPFTQPGFFLLLSSTPYPLSTPSRLVSRLPLFLVVNHIQGIFCSEGDLTLWLCVRL